MKDERTKGATMSSKSNGTRRLLGVFKIMHMNMLTLMTEEAMMMAWSQAPKSSLTTTSHGLVGITTSQLKGKSHSVSLLSPDIKDEISDIIKDLPVIT
jgi:hypothetical protein